MREIEMKTLIGRFVRGAAVASALVLAVGTQAAAPGITGTDGSPTPAFDLVATAGRVSQPDGASLYTWGYGCKSAPGGFLPDPTLTPGAACPALQMQLPGPTLIVHQNDTVTVTLTNNLPPAAGNTSILFPGFKVTASGGAPGVLTQEATRSLPVTYKFVADKAGTHSYYSGTQGDLQVEMGLYGVLIVLPTTVNTANCIANQGSGSGTLNDQARAVRGQSDFRLAPAVYDNAAACYDREYMFQFSEMDPRIHTQTEDQVLADQAKTQPCSQPTGCMVVDMEPYKAAYFLINGRAFPDDLDPNYASQYPSQPYNANPHTHPGELTLIRLVGQGRMQHPFHEHANHLRLLARDGSPLLTTNSNPAGPLLFTTTTTPGQTLDAIFQWTGKGLNWDVYAHVKDGTPGTAADGTGGNTDPCDPDANGYNTSHTAALNYYEWCADHERPLEVKPFGNVGGGGPVTLPDPNVLVNGAFYSGSPYLGPDATARAVGPTPIPPSGTIANDPGSEAGFAFMWHSHNEREITTNNIFPGGIMTMLLVDPWIFSINEAN